MEQAVLTVEDVVNTGSLNTRVLAGTAGVERKVLWAHSCEMHDPARWLGPHELLMTIGHCVPADAQGQREFVSKLDTAGLAGVVLGDHETLPPITPDMLEEADARDFPVLLTAAETPFAAIARTIAAATATTQTMQVLKLSKLYQVSTLAHTDPGQLLSSLQTLFRAGLRVIDGTTGLTILSGEAPGSVPASTRERAYPLPGDPTIKLVVSEYPGEEVGSFLVVHLLQVVDVGSSRPLRTIRRRMERAARVLGLVLEGKIPPEADTVLNADDIRAGYQVAAVPLADGDRVARAVAIRNLPLLAGPDRNAFLILFPAAHRHDLRALLKQLSVRAGSSSSFTDLRDSKFAASEAAKVLDAGGPSHEWSDFEGVPISFLTRSRQETHAIVRQVLGPLAGTDKKHAMLRETLFTFVANDRQWQKTASDLGIHRQSLAYRLARVRDITGRDVSTSGGLAAFWLAHQAWPAYLDSGRSPDIGAAP
ncbi:PucR family transcriptional regulator [Pseudarthrobacter phenanthrenivorans]|uniref:PucR family transcriptional regulator n=1 Tax=Pseudarthrobacter phenanthrenivorans TaxID=361575 RepID=A0A3B0FJA0_PSEPS|nr:PucR family transcriptional regulator [Pseudarthrobacter phenanthrenivorans]RKO19959.1 PucR family transcriptional regulator [Pseudarthrobacter phenanthrenivorans]